MTETIRILVADDHPLFREGVVNTLGDEPDIEVIAEASDGEGAVQQTVELLPDIAILDLTMPGIGGIAATSEISARCPATAVLILTVSEDTDDLLQALKAGARGYVLKGVSGQGLIHAVRSVTAGEVYITPALASGILSEMTRDDQADPFESLTGREHEILELVAAGLTNREIGERLYLAEKTVKHYMTNVLQKLHVRSRVEAALLAQRRSFENRS
ncbi:MAG: DNA-binding response regulator [Actinobacteria bacterium]|nr:MAG: DNA-binding response regulator [Actinomycetota bacterium]